jgi:hypothetical protein
MMTYADRFPFQIFFPLFLLATQVIEYKQWYKLALIGTAFAGIALSDLSRFRDEARWYAEYFPRLIQSHKQLALALRPFTERNYSLAVQDAGIIPYYSDWHSFDLVGLTDVELAHGGLTAPYLEARQPDLILSYGSRVPTPDDLPPGVLGDFIRTHSYELVGYTKWQPSYYLVIYLKKGLPDRDALVRAISKVQAASDSFTVDWKVFRRLGYLS